MTGFNLSKFVEDDDDIVDGKISTMFVKEFITRLRDNFKFLNKADEDFMHHIMNEYVGDKLK